MGRSSSIDILKGMLILWVMCGHIAEQIHASQFIFWIGSGLRMPMLFGISGYLLNLDRIRSATFSDLFGRYWHRLLLPWLFASLVYFLFASRIWTWTVPMDMMIRPAFHLWYVPVLCFLILLARSLPFSPAVLMMIGTPFSVAIIYADGLGHELIGAGYLAFDSRFLRYLLYFFFGMALARSTSAARYGPIALIATMIGMIWWAWLQHVSSPVDRMAAALTMNLGLIALLPRISLRQARAPMLGEIGRNSLFFYLWHPLIFGIALAWDFSPIATLMMGVAALWLSHRLMTRAPVLSRWFGILSASVPSRIAGHFTAGQSRWTARQPRGNGEAQHI